MPIFFKIKQIYNHRLTKMQEFLSNLEKCFEQPLPSNRAHIEMLPKIKIPNPATNKTCKAAKSSVLIMFYPMNNEIYTIFIKRSIYDGVHSGQIAFPGGKTEAGDKSLAETAIREANEEIGIDSSNIFIKGKLSDVYISPSNYIVTPFVGVYKGRPHFNPDSSEVNQLIKVRFSDIIDKRNKGKAQVKAANGQLYEVPSFNFNNHVVWGATAMMLNEFIVLWNSSN